MALKAALLSLGCKVNSYETEKIREDMILAGFEIVDFTEKADVYIVNTCSVTNIADRKSRQMLHKAKSINPKALVVATGCYVQTAEKDERLNDAADIIIGNNHKGSIAETIMAHISSAADDINLLDDIAKECEVENFSINDYSERSRAFVRIEDGCNQFCSYCIIPYARGRVRSRSEEDIISEVKVLAEKGFKEIVITGIHISSYGMKNYESGLKNEEWDSKPLLKLVQELDKIKGIERIRLGSLEPRIISREFAVGLKEIKSFCPHFHLSLQSGCDSVLKRMNRHYTAEDFLERCRILREVFDDPAITTDVIVGFPSETEEEFKESADMLKQAAFSKMHIFKYSRRKGTVADRMPGQLTEKVKHERSLVLQELDNKMHFDYASHFKGKTVKVLIEEEDGDEMSGLTERYMNVKISKNTGVFRFPDVPNDMNTELSADNSYINHIAEVKITDVSEDGILISK
ncbi:MAG: tRNA (N(6)-L-threonylcarbamoyladenosine(37)-C(2))-methylthiotransferase MtaB [Lachnospiraceae bacterium]|nr:tRNA (N(6)-L-threonylcarbamoyladenosine(37)-C(2))-methylthiotransferase MtaB [Lachnospiraceae bacterium]